MEIEEWLGNNQLSLDIWHKKYQVEGENFEQWLDRVSGGDKDIRQLILEKKFLFGGRILSNRGTNRGCMSNCNSLGYVEDSLVDIMQANTQLALTYKAQGGQGLSLSKLRPKGTLINGNFPSDGVIPFMRMFNTTTESISQGGNRRGALLIALDVWHKDIWDFISIKSQSKEINNANLSVEIDDKFMQYVQDYYKTGNNPTVHIKREYSGNTIEYDVKPVELYKAICKYARDYAEPGILFIDRMKKYNLAQYHSTYKIECTNACSEIPMTKHGACILGSINLGEYVQNPYTNQSQIDFKQLQKDIPRIVRAMDDIVTENQDKHILPEQAEVAKTYRNIGIGIMGLNDLLVKLGITYGSDKSINIANKIMKFIFRRCIYASVDLATAKGNFPGYESSVWDSDIIKTNFSDSEIIWLKKNNKLRNLSLVSIAPTGSIGTLLSVSTGAEPYFALNYTRKTVSLNNDKEQYYTVDIPAIQEYKRISGNNYIPNYFIGANDIPWKQRINMQSALQIAVDQAISSTVNLPETTTYEDVEQIYLYAWEQSLKGVTIYVQGTREPILSTETPKEFNNSAKEALITELKRGDVIKASNQWVGLKRILTTGCVDGETEYFNGTGWKKISEYSEGDKVLQYNEDGTTSLVNPLNYIKRESKGQYHITTKYGLDMMLSPDHRNVTFSRDGKFKIMTTQEIVDRHNSSKTGFSRRFKQSFYYTGPGINLTDEEIRISIAIFADGCFYSPTSKKCLISVCKKRKRDRLIELLNKANISYSENLDSDDYYNIKFYPPIEGRVKKFPIEWYNCNYHQLEVIFDEVFYWDGYKDKHNEYTTIHKSNADFIQFVCCSLGKKGSIYQDNRYNNITYRVDWSDRTLVSFIERPKKEIPFKMPLDGFDYCFSVPSTMLVLRRNDKVFITGNCGSLHCQAFFDPSTGELRECFLSKGSTGGCQNFMIGLSRMISLSARGGISIDDILEQLKSCGVCPSYAVRSVIKKDTSKGSCCPVAVGNALRDMHEEMLQRIRNHNLDIVTTEIKEQKIQEYEECPSCHEKTLTRQGGCYQCLSCGYSRCD